MKIIHIITGLSIGGAEQALYNLLKGGLAERFDNCVISLRDKGPMGLKISLLGVPVIALNMHVKTLPLAGLVKLIQIIINGYELLYIAIQWIGSPDHCWRPNSVGAAECASS